MAKKECAICKKKLGAFKKKIPYANKVVCSDCSKLVECLVCKNKLNTTKAIEIFDKGFFCPECMKKTGITAFSNSKSYTTESIKRFIEHRVPIAQSFIPTKKISSHFAIDENHKAFKIDGDIFEYNNLLSFELLEDKQSIIKGGLGRAILFGAVLGGAGALFDIGVAIVAGLTGVFVGAVTGGKKTKGVCNLMKLRITLKDSHVDTIYIPFIDESTPINSSEYQTELANVQSCISALEIIANYNVAQKDTPKGSEVLNVVNTAFSEADEILKFKHLLDEGIITNEEFEAKKKMLLNLPEVTDEAEEPKFDQEKSEDIAE